MRLSTINVILVWTVSKNQIVFTFANKNNKHNYKLLEMTTPIQECLILI